MFFRATRLQHIKQWHHMFNSMSVYTISDKLETNHEHSDEQVLYEQLFQGRQVSAWVNYEILVHLFQQSE